MADPILIGTRGWEDGHWIEHFYPAELPPDWRFCYYSNHLRSVLVPADLWPRVSRRDVAQWVEDSDPAFRFVLEIPRVLAQTAASEFAAGMAEFGELAAPIADQTSGFLLRLDAGVPLDLAMLETRIRALSRLGNGCVEVPDSWRKPELYACLERCGAAAFWDTSRDAQPQPGGRFLVALASGGDAREQRRILEQLAHWQGDSGRAALFFDDTPQAPELAKQARVIAELMGC